MESFTQTEIAENVTCPFCGLLCDDLTVERDADFGIRVIENACPKGAAAFARKSQMVSPRVAGKSVNLPEAVARAAEILKDANLPLIAGLGTEVQGMRAAMSLADKAGAVLDHMNSNGFMRNVEVVQNSGWQTCTLTEVRNRVDLLVIMATDVVSVFPRFFERYIWNKQSMFDQDTSAREIVYLGGRDIDSSAGIAPDGRKPTVLPCDLQRLPEVVAALRALLSDQPLHVTDVGGIKRADLESLSQRLKAANYSVVTWSAATLDFMHAELTVQNMTELIKTLNETTRSSGLPLGGLEGDVSVNQVSTWISGYPVRTSYARGFPEYDPYHFCMDRLLANGEADALFWLSSFNPERVPPVTAVPTVVLGHPDMRMDQEVDVFIPVGTPGVDHNGVIFRSDHVVSLPLIKLRDSRLPKLGDVVAMIEQSI